MMNASLDFISTLLACSSDPLMAKVAKYFEAGAALAKALTGPIGSDSYMLGVLDSVVGSIKAMAPGDIMMVGEHGRILCSSRLNISLGVF